MIVFMFSLFVVLLLIGVPISLTLGLTAALPLYFFSDISLNVVAQKMFGSVNSFSIMAVPFFMLAGSIFAKGGVSKRLVDLANSVVGWLPGGLAIVTFFACALFGAISGSSPATVAAMGSILVPAMLEAGYSMQFALATISAAGFLGIVIPPSIPMVMYGVSASANIGDLFMAGFLPGILLTLAMSCYAFLYGRKHLPKGEPFQIKKVLVALKNAVWALIMPVIILGGIYGGIFTATEAAVVACYYGLAIGIFVYKELEWRKLGVIFRDSIVQAGSILLIVATATAFGWVLTRENIPATVANGILNLAGGNKWIFLILVNLLLLAVGTFMETIPAILILTPILLPAANTLGINTIAFGVMMIVNLGIGMATRPAGINLFVAAGLEKRKLSDVVCRHLWYYLLFALLVLAVIVIFPGIVLLLPQMMA